MANNRFPIHTNKPPTNEHPTNLSNIQNSTHTHKWATFTYIGKETTYITNLFKKNDLKIALRTRNTLQKRLGNKHMSADKYMRSGAYKLTCPDCNMAYIGQTGRNFYERYKEHKNALKTKSHTSNYAKHVLEQSHTSGPVHQTMQILQYQDKGTHLNTIEQFFIYAEFSQNSHLNDEQSISPNRIFEALLKPHPHTH
jgi:protein-arginine kinase activator protein McsA